MPVLFFFSERKDESQIKSAHGDILRSLWSGDDPFDLSVVFSFFNRKIPPR